VTRKQVAKSSGKDHKRLLCHAANVDAWSEPLSGALSTLTVRSNPTQLSINAQNQNPQQSATLSPKAVAEFNSKNRRGRRWLQQRKSKVRPENSKAPPTSATTIKLCLSRFFSVVNTCPTTLSPPGINRPDPVRVCNRVQNVFRTLGAGFGPDLGRLQVRVASPQIGRPR
jgi:hypothetical protein